MKDFGKIKLKIRLKIFFAISDKFNSIHAVGKFVQSLNNSANCSMAAKLILDKNHRYMNLLGLESKLRVQKMECQIVCMSYRFDEYGLSSF